MSPQSTIINDWADYWFKLGVNVIPADTKNKTTTETWSQWKDKPMSIETFEFYKENGYYNKGIALIPGPLWRGPFKGKYLVAIDLDNPKAIEEFCRNGLEDLKQRTLVEQSANPDKMHLYFIVEREIPNKASDKVDVTKATKIQANEIPALEVKSNGKGIMFCACSPHQNGSNYRIIGTLTPEVFPAQELEDRIGGICDKYGFPYGSSNNNYSSNNNSDIGPSIQELFAPGTRILKGHNRHLGILRVMDSLLIKNMGLLTLEQIKNLAYQRNQELCDPPLDDRDLEGQWEQSLEWANKKKKEREKAKQTQDQNNNNNKSTTKTKLEKIDPIEEAVRLLIAKHRFATIYESKVILYYDGDKGVYVKDGERLIEEEVDRTFGFDVRTPDINEIMKSIMRKTYVNLEEFDANINIINIENGLLNSKTGQLSPHSQDYYSLNQIPIKYNPNAKAPKFEKFLNEVLYPEQIRTAMEIIAYTFIRKNIFQYWFVLIGNGGNGKNVFVGIVSSLHGKKNVSNVPLIHLANPNLRFALSRLENKNINVDTELSVKSYNDLSTLKKLTDTQQIPIEYKGKDPFDVELWAKLFLCCNELPASSDDSDARYRREIILAFPYQFEEEQNDDPNIKVADPFLLDKIVTDEEEMSGILNIVIDSLKTIYENKKIYVNSTIKQRRAKAELIADPVKAFYDEMCEIPSDPAAYEKKEDLHNTFVKFCNSKRLYIPSYKEFFKKLKKEHNTLEGRAIIKDPIDNKEHKPRVLFNIHLLTEEEKKKRDEEQDAE